MFITSNDSKNITTSKTINYIDMSSYFETQKFDVLHFIFDSLSLNDLNENVIRDVIVQQMFKICLSYAKHMQCR